MPRGCVPALASRRQASRARRARRYARRACGPTIVVHAWMCAAIRSRTTVSAARSRKGMSFVTSSSTRRTVRSLQGKQRLVHALAGLLEAACEFGDAQAVLRLPHGLEYTPRRDGQSASIPDSPMSLLDQSSGALDSARESQRCCRPRVQQSISVHSLPTTCASCLATDSVKPRSRRAQPGICDEG